MCSSRYRYAAHIDALADMLNGVRARSAAFCRVALVAPWALRIADRAPLALAATLRGEAWIVPDDGAPTLVPPGAVALVNGTDPYTVADDPSSPYDIVVGPDNVLLTTDGTPLPEEAIDTLRAEGSATSTVVVSGTYRVPGDVGRRLLDALPGVLVVGPSAGLAGLELLAAEVGVDAPGQQAMLDRLLDVALIETLRAWFAQPDTDVPGWYAADVDPVVGPALRLLHDDPAARWTIERLAHEVGVSRATLARRFRAIVGEPPMAYLTNWRVTLAADLLRSTDLTVEAIARRIGYADGFALSVAFQRLRGIRPSDHRRDTSANTAVASA